MPNTVALAPVRFSNDDVVIRTGKIFECGDYPDKAFSLDESEADAAIAAFTEAPLDLEHMPTVLSGKLGRLIALRREGKVVFGDVELPRWLNDAIGAVALKVSPEWHRLTKRITRLALTMTPAISDAAIFSAYAQFAGARNNAADQRTIQAVHDHSVSLGANCDMKNVPAEFAQERKPMAEKRSFFQFLHDVWKGENESAVAFSDTAPVDAAPQPAASVLVDDEEKVRLRAELEAERAGKVIAQAEAFADGEIAANRAYPAEREALVASFAQAARDDTASGSVTFGADTKTRVQLLKEQQAARPAHSLNQELLTGDAAVFANQQETDDPTRPKAPSRERTKQLLEMTPLGRAAVQNQRN